MSSVLIAGSIKIKRLHPLFVERIENVVREGMSIIVGDANGADASMQAELVRQSASDVTVYCTGDKPRNNLGDWRVHHVQSSAQPGTRAYFTAKDIEMAKQADFGLMLWDAASTGTLSNVFELLSQDKKSVVFVNREKTFVNVKRGEDILGLVSHMSEAARRAADRKIRLGEKVSQLSGFQTRLAV